MVILSPVLLQIVTPLGISPIQFGLVMLLSLCIAFVTPPVASNLFVDIINVFLRILNILGRRD